VNPAFVAIVFAAVIVEATAGFGATVVTVTLASHLMPVEEVLATFMPLNVVMATWIVARNHPLVDWSLLGRRVLPVMGLGFAGGLLLVDHLAHPALKAAFGVFVALLAVAELTGARDTPPSPNAARAALLGSGLIHGLFACGGPLLVWVIGRELPEKGRFRATLQAVWWILGVLLLARYTQAGHLTRETLSHSAWLMLALLVAMPIGEAVHRRIAPGPFRKGVFGLLFFAGASLAVRTLLAA
jgi:uncharacterized membrane protein YfcA